MNIRDMTYLVAVADLRSFSGAAQRCFVSQPTLSGQIKKLEDQLGVTLFERTNKRVMVTEIGEKIVASAREILREVDHMKEMAAHSHDPLAGTFRLGAFPTLSTYLFPPLVPKIKKSLPKLKLILAEEKTASLIEQLHKGEIDAALLALPIDDSYLETKPLFNDEFMLAVPADHALAKKRNVSQLELAKHPLLLLEEGHCLRDQALEVCSLHNISEEQDFRATSLETLRQMVKAGTGITFMPRIAIGDKDKNIAYIPFKRPAPYRTIGLVLRKTTTRLAVMEKLIALLS